MFCPACGTDTGDAKFCPDCGTDLRSLSASTACGACGSELPPGARFCPECGEAAGSAGVAERGAAATAGGRRTGTRGKGGGRQSRREPRGHPPAVPAGRRGAAATPARTEGRISPLIAWGVLGAVAVIAVVVVVVVSGGFGGGSSGTPAGTGTQSVQPVAADTSGSYGELVQRANGLYDQGASRYQGKQYAQGAEYFAAAAKVYAAAWKLQSTDPSVGTDYATSLFYSGETEAAITQVDEVLAKSPDFQTAWFNKGNYLAEQARQAEQAGKTKKAKTAYAGASAAYQKAVDLDPASSSGQQAKQQLSELPQ
jgi:hypothetical protein